LNKLFLSTTLSWLARAGTIGYQLFLIPIIVNAFGLVGYGKIALLQGLIVWFSLMDYGGGVLFQNKFSMKKREIGLNEKLSLYLLMFILVCILLTLLAIQSSGHLSVYILGSREYQKLLEITIIYLSLSVFLDFFIKILYAYEKSILVSLQMLISTAVSFLLIIYFDVESLLGVISLIFIPQLIFKLFLAVYVWKNLISFRLPDNNKIKREVAKILKECSPYFWFALVACMTLNADLLIVNSFLSESEVAIYLLISRVYAMGFVFYSTLLTILWPRFVNLIHERKIVELNEVLIGIFIPFTLIIIICSLVLYFCFGEISEFIFVGVDRDYMVLSPILIMLFCIYYIVRIYSDCYAILLQCSGETMLLTRIVPFQALLSLMFQIVLASYMGAEGIVLGIILSFVFTVAVMLPKEFYKTVKEI